MPKKFSCSTFCILIIIISGTLLFGEERGENLPALQILGSLSIGYANNSDLDNATEENGRAEADYYNLLITGDSFTCDNSSACFTYGFDFDIRLFYGNIGFGAEIGYHEAESKSEIGTSGWEDKASYTNTISVIPVTTSIFYRIPVGQSSDSFVLIGCGLGYYSGKLKIDFKDENSLPGDESYILEGRNRTIGYHAVVEYNYFMGNGLTFFTGIKARYVQFDEFENGGNAIMYRDENIKGSLTGVIWFFGAGLSL